MKITSYAEVVLESPAADALHPAFGNLFVQTEIVRQRQAILCTRRPRSSGEAAPSMFHLMSVHGANVGEVSYGDRPDAVHRTWKHGQPDPPAISGSATLSDGGPMPCLDPIVAIRRWRSRWTCR